MQRFCWFLLWPSLLLADTDTLVSMTADGQLRYHGSLNAAANSQLFALYDDAEPKPTVLRITSSGGNVDVGLDLGEWVHTKGLNVEILRGCASSCANYVFTAAVEKFLHPDSILFWHGGATSQNVQDEVDRGRVTEAYVQNWIGRERAFFEKIGVDYRITTYGAEETSSWFVRYDGWDYSIDDLSKLGVQNVHQIDGIWDWRSHPSNSKVKRIEVRDEDLHAVDMQ